VNGDWGLAEWYGPAKKRLVVSVSRMVGGTAIDSAINALKATAGKGGSLGNFANDSDSAQAVIENE
jgi:hypothetical protein